MSTTIKVCEHESDYASYCTVTWTWNSLICAIPAGTREKPVRIDADTVNIFRPNQIRAVRLRCLRCGTDVTKQNNCTRCFPAD